MLKHRDGRRAPLSRMTVGVLLVLSLLVGVTPTAATAVEALPTNSAEWRQLNASLPDHAELERRLAEAEPMRWLFTGDSITHGVLHTLGYKRFSEYIEEYLRTTPVAGHDRSADLVLNTAVSSGRTVCPESQPGEPCLDLNFDSWVSDRQADVVFFSLAMNDGRQNPPWCRSSNTARS